MKLNENLITDKEFLKMIPNSTEVFIERCIKYLKAFNQVDYDTILKSMLLVLYFVDVDYSPLFKKYGLEIRADQYSKIDLSPSFSTENVSYFRIPNYPCEKNIILTPLRIIQYYFQLDFPRGTKIMNSLGIDRCNNLQLELNKLVELEEKRLTNEKSINYLKGLKPATINYLEYVGKIYTKLLQYEDIDIIGYSEDSLKALSYFLALYLFKDTSQNANYNEVINQFFISKGLAYEEILKVLNIELKDLDSIDPTLILNVYFSEYSEATNMTVSEIVNIQFIARDERNIVIKKLLNACDIDFEIINELCKVLEDLNKTTNTKPKSEYDKELNPDVIRFIEDSYKIHRLIIPENASPLIDGKIIQSIYDYILIAILINSYHTNGLLAQFFNDNGIKLEDIYEIIGTKVDFAKLDNVVINEKNIVINFYKFLNHNDNDKKYINIVTSDYENAITSLSTTNSLILHRIFFHKTKRRLPESFSDMIQNHLRKKVKKENEEIIERLFLNMDINVYKYLSYVSSIYNSIKFTNFPKRNAQVISLLLATQHISYYKEGSLKEYLASIGLKADNIIKYLKLGSQKTPSPEDIYPKLLEMDFKDFIFNGVNTGKKKEEITIESIIENALNKELNDSYQINLLLEKLKLDYDSLKDLDKKAKEYTRAKKEKEATDNVYVLKSNCEDWYKCIYEATKTLKVLRKNSSKLSYKLSDDDFKVLSLLIGFFKVDSPYKKYFENQGITLLYVLHSINCPQDELIGKTQCEISDLEMYEQFKNLMSDLYKFYEVEERKDKYDVSYIGRRLFNNNIFNSDILSKIIGDKKVYDIISSGIINEIIVPLKVSLEQLLNQLEEQVKYKPEVDTSSIDSILEFILEGDSGLSKYSEYIQLQIKEINEGLNLDESLDNIDDMVEDIYIDVPVKQNFLARIFTSKNGEKNIERTVDTDVLSKLTEEIDTHIESLAIQVRKYREIFKAISLYLGAIKNYYEISVEVRDLLLEKREILENTEENYSEILDVQQALEGITDKINGYERTNVLMKNQQFQIYQTIVNHLISRNALQTSKDDIIPIISSEMLFSISSISSRNALELSNNLIGLFKNVIEQNVDGAKENLEMLKISNLPQETIDKIIADFSTYIEEVDKNREEILKLSAPAENEENKSDVGEKEEQVKVKKLRKKNEW